MIHTHKLVLLIGNVLLAMQIMGNWISRATIKPRPKAGSNTPWFRAYTEMPSWATGLQILGDAQSPSPREVNTAAVHVSLHYFHPPAGNPILSHFLLMWPLSQGDVTNCSHEQFSYNVQVSILRVSTLDELSLPEGSRSPHKWNLEFRIAHGAGKCTGNILQGGESRRERFHTKTMAPSRQTPTTLLNRIPTVLLPDKK